MKIFYGTLIGKTQERRAKIGCESSPSLHLSSSSVHVNLISEPKTSYRTLLLLWELYTLFYRTKAFSRESLKNPGGNNLSVYLFYKYSLRAGQMSGTELSMVFGEIEPPSFWPSLFQSEQPCCICFIVGVLGKEVLLFKESSKSSVTEYTYLKEVSIKQRYFGTMAS